MRCHMTDIKFDKMVSYYRKLNGWTMKELAEKMGKTESAVSRWESGTASPKIKDINVLSEILGIDADILIFGKSKLVEPTNDIISETIEIMQKLDEEHQKNILNFARFEYAQAEQAKQLEENDASVS
ncbi:helix-turn-helix domain-containing protein [Lactococcus raffinolactis]|uniref:Helix-turn-helix domain-containing protein n=2 Tax=Streptococcaceae TaxID=1300 RepID=A0AAE6YLK1_9LACT|nr:helix-turn-helix domain-containing protein [Lactococcus raffinolactis]